MTSRLSKVVRSDGARATLSNAVRALGRLAATVLIARMGGVEAVGLLALLVASEAVLISTVNALFAAPATVLAPGRRKSLRSVIHAEAEKLQMASGFVLSIVTAIAGIAAGLSLTLTSILALYLLLASIYQARRSTRLAEFRSGRVLVAELFIACLGLTGPALASIVKSDPVAAFWLAQATAHGLGVLWLPATLPGGLGATRAVLVARRSILRTGHAMVVGSLANSLSTRTPAFLIASLVGQASVGLFGAANTFAAPIRMLSGALRGVLLPRLAQCQRRGTNVRVSWWLACVVFVLIAMVAGLAALAAPMSVQLLYGEGFADAARLVPICVTFAMLGTLASIVSCARQAAGESDFVARVRVVGAFVSPVLFACGLALGGVPVGLLFCILVEGATLFVLCSPMVQAKSTNRSQPPRLPRGMVARG